MSMDDNSVVKYIIGAARVKYDVLDPLFQKVNYRQYRMGVMIIDAHSIFTRLFREKHMANIYSENEGDMVRDLVVGFFNVIGHYRRYMATRMQMDNDIFVMFNRKLPKYHKQLDPDYNSKVFERYTGYGPDYAFTVNAIEKAYTFICGISPYFEGIYCLDNNGVDDCALATRFMQRDDIFYIINSRNLFYSQLIRENAVQLYCSRDKSKLLTTENCYKDGILNKLKTEADSSILPSMLPILWSFAGCPDISVDSMNLVSGIAQMIKIVNKLLKTGLSPETSMEEFLEFAKLAEAFDAEKLEWNLDDLKKRYQYLNAQIAGAAITSDQWAKIASMCYDIFDETGLEDLNEKLVATGEIDPQILEIENLNMSTAVMREYYGEDW